jgi:hypothetical protein
MREASFRVEKRGFHDEAEAILLVYIIWMELDVSHLLDDTIHISGFGGVYVMELNAVP